MRGSPKRLRWFASLQQTDATSIHLYCPTCWILWENALSSVMANYAELWVFMEDVSYNYKSNAGAKAAGIANQLSKCQTYFNLQSLHKIFASVGTSNQALQNSKLLFQNGNEHIPDLKKLLQIYRNNCNQLRTSAVAVAERMKIGEPTLLHIRKAPRTFDRRSRSHIFTAPEEYYKQQYLELTDTVNNALKGRFDTET